MARPYRPFIRIIIIIEIVNLLIAIFIDIEII